MSHSPVPHSDRPGLWRQRSRLRLIGLYKIQARFQFATALGEVDSRMIVSSSRRSFFRVHWSAPFSSIQFQCLEWTIVNLHGLGSSPPICCSRLLEKLNQSRVMENNTNKESSKQNSTPSVWIPLMDNQAHNHQSMYIRKKWDARRSLRSFFLNTEVQEHTSTPMRWSYPKVWRVNSVKIFPNFMTKIIRWIGLILRRQFYTQAYSIKRPHHCFGELSIIMFWVEVVTTTEVIANSELSLALSLALRWSGWVTKSMSSFVQVKIP